MNKKNENNNNSIKIKSINTSETNNSKKDYDNEDDYINSEINNETNQNEYFNINSQKKFILFPEVFPLNKNEKSIESKKYNIFNELTANYSSLKKKLSSQALISNHEKLYCNSFRNLCSTKENSIQLNSSYENINKISNYKYINDFILQNKTKDFIVDECEKKLFTKKNELLHRRHNSLINLHQMKLNYEKSTIVNKKSQKKCYNFINNQTINSSNSLKKILNKKPQYGFLQKYQSEISSPKKKILKATSLCNYANYTFIKSFSPIRNKKKIINKKSLIGKKLNVISKNIQNAKEAINNPNEFYMNFFSNILKKETGICSNLGEISKSRKSNNKLMKINSSVSGLDNNDYVNKSMKIDSEIVT
jgi:hypothetical protein